MSDTIIALRKGLDAALAERNTLTAERDFARGLCMEALGALEDWEDCDTKAQHISTITGLQALFDSLCKPSDATLQPFRDALAEEGKP